MILNFNRKKIIKFSIVFILLGSLYYRYFLYIDIKNACFIRLKPSIIELSSVSVKQGIKILRNAYPEEYQKVCANINTINPNYACGGINGGCYYSGPRDNLKEINISTTRTSNLAWVAAVIAHETCHAIQKKENRPMSEPECYGIGGEVLKKITAY